MRHDLTDLRLFVNVGETLNLTRAAERTFLSLPAASARVKNMEEAFKARLLVRMATGVALTPAGEVLLKHANAVFRQLECLNADLQPYASGLKGLRLLANTTATNSFLADALSTFLAENPDVDVELEEKISGDIVIAIRAGAGDLGIVAGNIDVEGLDVTPLFRDELTVVAALDHPLASLESAHFADLIDAYQFVGIHPNSAIQTFLEDIASGLGKRICQRVHVGSFEAVCRMVEAGAGIAVPRLRRALQPAGRVARAQARRSVGAARPLAVPPARPRPAQLRRVFHRPPAAGGAGAVAPAGRPLGV